MSLKRSLGLLLLLVTTASSSWAESDAGARQIAERTAAQWNAAFARGGLEDILALYSDNAMLLQPNGAVSRGPGEIRDFWAKLIRQGDYAMDVIEASHEHAGTIVATVRFSDVKTLPNGGQETMRYSYGGLIYSVLRQQADGSWKAEVQRWNSDRRS